MRKINNRAQDQGLQDWALYQGIPNGYSTSKHAPINALTFNRNLVMHKVDPQAIGSGTVLTMFLLLQ